MNKFLELSTEPLQVELFVYCNGILGCTQIGHTLFQVVLLDNDSLVLHVHGTLP